MSREGVNEVTVVRNDVHPGAKIGAWTVIHRATRGKYPSWLAECSCGRKKIVRDINLRTGASSRCINCAASRGDGLAVRVGEKIDTRRLVAYLGKAGFLVSCDCGWLGEQVYPWVYKFHQGHKR